jgi:hypothetical protein
MLKLISTEIPTTVDNTAFNFLRYGVQFDDGFPRVEKKKEKNEPAFK